MRVCPKCRYKDPSYWKPSAFHPEINHTRSENFQAEFPELFQKLKIKGYIADGFYAYHLTKGGNVERQEISENPKWKEQWYIPTESKNHNLPSHLHNPAKLVSNWLKRDRSQTKLLETKKEEEEGKG